jgi:malonate transporter and related proteins
MHAVLNAALPIFALILTGFACGRSGVPSPAATDSPNRFAIYLALPALMFLAMTVLARNPLRLRPFAGFAVGMSRLGLPDPIERSASLLGGAASPCALVCIGLFLAQERLVSSYALAIGVLVGLKLLFQPAVTAVVALYNLRRPAGLVASGCAAKRAADRIWAVYGRQALWVATRGDLRRDPGIANVASVATVSALVAYLG